MRYDRDHRRPREAYLAFGVAYFRRLQVIGTTSAAEIRLRESSSVRQSPSRSAGFGFCPIFVAPIAISMRVQQISGLIIVSSQLRDRGAPAENQPGSAVAPQSVCSLHSNRSLTCPVAVVAGGVGCSIETGSEAGKVSLRASSSTFSWCLRSRLPSNIAFMRFGFRHASHFHFSGTVNYACRQLGREDAHPQSTPIFTPGFDLRIKCRGMVEAGRVSAPDAEISSPFASYLVSDAGP